MGNLVLGCEVGGFVKPSNLPTQSGTGATDVGGGVDTFPESLS